ncbi:MAG: hypothetical protein LLG04_10895 [Parachlamydia sp.]|nr:hypothetical protein [Parachlamydia sp.]
MAILDSIGTTLTVGGQTAISGYFTESETVGEKEVASEDIDDNDGALATRLIFKRLPTVDLSLVCKASAVPTTDFPRGSKCPSTAGAYSGWFVDSCSAPKTKSAWRATVKLTSLGI